MSNITDPTARVFQFPTEWDAAEQVSAIAEAVQGIEGALTTLAINPTPQGVVNFAAILGGKLSTIGYVLANLCAQMNHRTNMAADEIMAIQQVLGINPHEGHPDVAARIAAIEEKLARSIPGPSSLIGTRMTDPAPRR